MLQCKLTNLTAFHPHMQIQNINVNQCAWGERRQCKYCPLVVGVAEGAAEGLVWGTAMNLGLLLK